MRKRPIIFAIVIFAGASLACGNTTPPDGALQPIPTLAVSPLDTYSTVYGFFPSPPEVSLESVINTYRALGEHADVVLLQQAVEWDSIRSER